MSNHKTRCTSQREGIFSITKADAPLRVKKVLAAARARKKKADKARCPQGGIAQVSISKLLPISLDCIENARREAVRFGTGKNIAPVSGFRK